jgi:uncharacterized protein YidB (DUF937 family)
MKINGKTRIMAVGLSAVLAIGVAGAVLAAGTGGSDNGSGPAGTADALHGHPRLRAAKGLLKSAADTIGIDVKDLVQQLRSEHTTIGAIATAKGVDPQTVIDNAVTQANAAIDQLVADGKLKPERAAVIKEKLPERIAQIVNQGPRHRGDGHGAPAPTNP